MLSGSWPVLSASVTRRQHRRATGAAMARANMSAGIWTENPTPAAMSAQYSASLVSNRTSVLAQMKPTPAITPLRASSPKAYACARVSSLQKASQDAWLRKRFRGSIEQKLGGKERVGAGAPRAALGFWGRVCGIHSRKPGGILENAPLNVYLATTWRRDVLTFSCSIRTQCFGRLKSAACERYDE